MKLSELKKVIETLIEAHGDNEILISVRDYYSLNGFDATLDLEVKSALWSGVHTNQDTKTTRLDACLKPSRDFLTNEESNPKITFRK